MGELLKTNMGDIYRRLIFECGSVFPEVLLFKKTDFNGRIARYGFKDGRSIICLKHGKNDAEWLIDEISNPRAPVYEAEEWMNHSVSDEVFSRLACITVLISEILDIECPQVELRTHMNDLGVVLPRLIQ
ncbi:MAG: hypothetical protein LIO80_02860 [Lachnospiraceae bacterium]|nr:hypothetical protein [Lachnospiraceae bacterium]